MVKNCKVIHSNKLPIHLKYISYKWFKPEIPNHCDNLSLLGPQTLYPPSVIIYTCYNFMCLEVYTWESMVLTTVLKSIFLNNTTLLQYS